ncbi:hypothetical protein BLNAU_3095 [Blattamonas nauphoetae]|uniref:Uncharacterized protein n=1 Tax=Blattamonas nauphoetae TaxID=2049346 RepID=A0ABQ9YE44_9EUKA|nr:hypothetical protein BLNAU_3095 [Blattamonas nauphoetae]
MELNQATVKILEGGTGSDYAENISSLLELIEELKQEITNREASSTKLEAGIADMEKLALEKQRAGNQSGTLTSLRYKEEAMPVLEMNKKMHLELNQYLAQQLAQMESSTQ